MKKDIALITFHAAYNYGSMLQAYATQETVNRLGGNCAIINYRMKEQKDYYALLRSKYGLTTLAKDIVLIPFMRKRKLAADRYEDFINNKLNVTEEFSEPEDIGRIWDEYEITISGSDQIWNKHAFELEHNDWKYMYPYLLKGFQGKKVSYASSIGGMSDSELEMIIPYLNQFDSISVREDKIKSKLEKVLNTKIHSVLDPTFLLSSSEWINNLSLKKKEQEPYILYYSLRGYKLAIPRLKVLKELARQKKCKIKVITPSFYIPYFDSHFEYLFDLGPIEFLEELYNASMVVSESYHGTILAINFNKDVYSIVGKVGAEYRKSELLKKLGMEDRIIYNVDELLSEKEDIDYKKVNERIAINKALSIDYLTNALEL